MKNINIFLIFFVANNLGVSLNTLLHRYPRHVTTTKRPYVKTHFEADDETNILVNEARLVACGRTELCQKVESFKITDNTSYNCYDKYLPLVFDSMSLNGTKLLAKGFLEQNSVHIHQQQIQEGFCKKIKRYYVNEKILIFTVDEAIHITERSKVNKMIEKELYVSYEYWTLFLFKLGIYDENKDDILYHKALKEFSFLFLCAKFTYLLVAYAFCFYKCFKMVMEEHSNKTHNQTRHLDKKTK